jgi:6-phosphogluconate dehydrogenase (decarboxylating)
MEIAMIGHEQMSADRARQLIQGGQRGVGVDRSQLAAMRYPSGGHAVKAK